jgi:hypothetical protein
MTNVKIKYMTSLENTPRRNDDESLTSKLTSDEIPGFRSSRSFYVKPCKRPQQPKR